MLTAEQINQAAEHLINARRAKSPGDLIPEAYRPQDRDSAIAVQNRVMELLGEPIAGYKCGVPAANGPLVFAPIPASAILRSSPVAVPPPTGKIEPEIAFVVARDLPPRATPYTDDEIRASIKEARMVVELIANRYEDKFAPTPLDLLSDHYNHHGLFIGPVVPGVFEMKLETLPVKIVTPEKALFDKTGPHPSGHPLKSYTWLVHFLNQHGSGVKAGQIATTGSYAGMVDAPLGVPLYIELTGVGVIDLVLVPQQ